MDEMLIDGRKLKPEEILAEKPPKSVEKEIKMRLARDPGSLCLSDYANPDCRKCFGEGRTGKQLNSNQPVVCSCVYKNFVKGTWFRPKQIMARLERESRAHKEGDAFRTEASDPPKIITSSG